MARTLTHMNLWRLVSTVAWGEDAVGREEWGGGRDEDMPGLFSRPSATILCVSV